MHSTEKVTESAMMDKSLSSLEETKTSVAEAAVCLPSHVEKSLAIKCSDKILVCYKRLKNGSANSTATPFRVQLLLGFTGIEIKIYSQFSPIFHENGKKETRTRHSFFSKLERLSFLHLTDFIISKGVLWFLYEEHFPL